MTDRRGPVAGRREILALPAFAYFWSASTIRAFATAMAGVALQILIVTVIEATPLRQAIAPDAIQGRMTRRSGRSIGSSSSSAPFSRGCS